MPRCFRLVTVSLRIYDFSSPGTSWPWSNFLKLGIPISICLWFGGSNQLCSIRGFLGFRCNFLLAQRILVAKMAIPLANWADEAIYTLHILNAGWSLKKPYVCWLSIGVWTYLCWSNQYVCWESHMSCRLNRSICAGSKPQLPVETHWITINMAGSTWWKTQEIIRNPHENLRTSLTQKWPLDTAPKNWHLCRSDSSEAFSDSRAWCLSWTKPECWDINYGGL